MPLNLPGLQWLQIGIRRRREVGILYKLGTAAFFHVHHMFVWFLGIDSKMKQDKTQSFKDEYPSVSNPIDLSLPIATRVFC